MNRWEERIKNHGIWPLLQEFGPALDQAAKTDQFTRESTDDIARLKLILTLVGKRLEAVDSMLIVESSLNHIENQFRTALPEVTAFSDDHDEHHLAVANDLLDSALLHLAGLGIPSTSDDIGRLRTAATEYREELDRQRSQSKEAVAELTSTFSKLREDYKAAAASAEREASSFAQQIHSQLTTLNAEVSSTKARADAVIAEMQSQFSHSQEFRQTEFVSHQTMWTNALNDMKAQMADDRKQLHDSEVAKSQELLHDMEKRRREIETLVGVIGNLGMTSGFQKEAAEAKDQAIRWQLATVGSMICLIIWLAISVFFPQVANHYVSHTVGGSATLQWLNIATRILIAVAFGVLSRYSATQADRYLAIQRTNRKLELELQALGPYLAPLPPAQQETFRIGLAKKVFGRQDSQHTGDLKRSPASFIDVLATDETRDLLEKLIPLLNQPDIAKALADFVGMLSSRKA